jgi:hypothetical protein
MVKNIAVAIKPLKNVEIGVLTITPGAKMPTTKEPKVILALSKKKSDTILDLSFISIKNKFTTIEANCQGVKGQEKMTGWKVVK